MERTDKTGGFPKKSTRLVRDYALMLAGASLTAVAAKYIFDPAGLVTGGATGLSIIIRQLTERYWTHTVPLWLSTLLINLPGSPKAVKESLGFILTTLEHGLKTLRGSVAECGR